MGLHRIGPRTNEPAGVAASPKAATSLREQRAGICFANDGGGFGQEPAVGWRSTHRRPRPGENPASVEAAILHVNVAALCSGLGVGPKIRARRPQGNRPRVRKAGGVKCDLAQWRSILAAQLR